MVLMCIYLPRYAEVAEISAVIGETLANETNIHEGLAGMGYGDWCFV